MNTDHSIGTVHVLGREIVDPLLQFVSGIGFILFFVAIASFVYSNKCVDEERIRKEESIKKVIASGILPSRILTEGGRKLRKVAWIAVSIGVFGFLISWVLSGTK